MLVAVSRPAAHQHHSLGLALLDMPKRRGQLRSVSTSTRVDTPAIYKAAVSLLDDLFSQENPNDIIVTFVRVKGEPLEVINAAIRYLTEIY